MDTFTPPDPIRYQTQPSSDGLDRIPGMYKRVGKDQGVCPFPGGYFGRRTLNSELCTMNHLGGRPMRKGLIATVVFIAVLIFGGFSSAREHQMDRGGRHLRGGGEKGHHGMMEPGMGMMGPGMGMMGPMMGSPEIMGTMMAIHGEIMILMGEMMQKYGRAMDQMTPEVRQQMQREVLERLGGILAKQGKALQERAKAGGR